MQPQASPIEAQTQRDEVIQAGPADTIREVARLEQLLAARARDARRLRGEVERRDALLRELTARIGSENGGGAGAVQAAAPPAEREVDGALQTRCDAAVQRALEAEAGRAEALFALDEAVAGAGGGGGVALAEAEGTARGLRAALQEVREARDIAEARLILAEHDRDGAREQIQGLRRELEHAREQLELELVRVHAQQRATAQQLELALEQSRSQAGTLDAPGSEHAAEVAAAQLDVLRGERIGLALRLDEAERALLALAATWPAGQAGLAAPDAPDAPDAHEPPADGTPHTEADALEEERARSAELRESLESLGAMLRAQQADADALRAEREQLREHLEDFETAESARRGALQAASEAAEQAYRQASDQLQDARRSLGETRDTLVSLDAGVKTLADDPPASPVAGGLATVPGELDAPGTIEDAVPADEAPRELLERVRLAEERLQLVTQQRAADADNHVASLASHRAQLELSRTDAAGLREDLARQGARMEAVRTALRALRQQLPAGSPASDRLADAMRILG